MTLPPLSAVGRHPVDYNLGLVFQFLDVQTIIYIFTALLLQQRVVFLSSSYAILVLISEVSDMILLIFVNEARFVLSSIVSVKIVTVYDTLLTLLSLFCR